MNESCNRINWRHGSSDGARNMIELDPLSQQRIVARIGARKRGKIILREDVFQAASRGFAPDAIGEHYGRTAKWAEQILYEKLPR